MPKFLNNIDVNQNELQNPVIHPSSSAPLDPKEAQMYYNTIDKKYYRFDGTNWVTSQDLITVNGILQGDGSGNINAVDQLILYCGTSTEVVS